MDNMYCYIGSTTQTTLFVWLILLERKSAMADPIRFQAVCAEIIGAAHIHQGIGTLQEKTLHAVLKRYYQPDQDSHEIPVGKFVADIVGEDGIIEIQTTQFNKLIEKLSAFLEVCPVTVVHPLIQKRRLIWIDPDTGEQSAGPARRQDPRPDLFLELYRIREFLKHPRLTLRFPLLEIDEYRLLHPKQKNPRRRGSRFDKIPNALLEEWTFYTEEDFLRFLPAELSGPFTIKEFMAAARAGESTARLMVRVLSDLGLVEQTGKRGRCFLYEKTRPYLFD